MNEAAYLCDALSRRLYLAPGERDTFLHTAMRHNRHMHTFCSVLYSTGCPHSEAIHLTPRQVDCADQVIMVDSLKNAQRGVQSSASAARIVRHPRQGPRLHREPETAQKTRTRSTIVVLVPHHRRATCGHRHEAGRHHRGSPTVSLRVCAMATPCMPCRRVSPCLGSRRRRATPFWQ
jgi:integrase